VVERLLAAGMVVLGKTQMVEFAFGGWGANPKLGTPWNPWDLGAHRVPGGSSSGSGVAVAAGLAPAAIGSDTGGSIRIPASLVGITGLKTTGGLISLRGAFPLSSTLDSMGAADAQCRRHRLADARDGRAGGTRESGAARCAGDLSTQRIVVLPQEQVAMAVDPASRRQSKRRAKCCSRLEHI